MKSFSETIVKLTSDELIGHPLNDVEKKFAPQYVFIKGNREIMSFPRVSVIGTRKPSRQGVTDTIILTKQLLKKNIVIVSGLARGIDSIAHKTTIRFGGKTIAVLGTPLNVFYPPENEFLQNEIMKNHLAISQFPLETQTQRKNFPIRNRTMALFSHASIIVEAGEQSGTLHQGWEALRLGRPLFIVDHIMQNGDLEWPSKFIRYGARILRINDIETLLDPLPTPGVIKDVTF